MDTNLINFSSFFFMRGFQPGKIYWGNFLWLIWNSSILSRILRRFPRLLSSIPRMSMLKMLQVLTYLSPHCCLFAFRLSFSVLTTPTPCYFKFLTIKKKKIHLCNFPTFKLLLLLAFPAVLPVMLSSKLLPEMEMEDNSKREQLLLGMQNLPLSLQIDKLKVRLIIIIIFCLNISHAYILHPYVLDSFFPPFFWFIE